MIMIDTQLAVELARTHQKYKTASFVCKEPLDPNIRPFWERRKRRDRARFITLAEKLADQLIEEKYHGMEGP